MLRIALLLEVIGFFMTAVLVTVMHWEKVRPISDKVKYWIVDAPNIFWRTLRPIGWVMRVYGKRLKGIDASEKRILRPIRVLEALFAIFLFSPIILFLLFLAFLALQVMQQISQLLSGHMVVTKLLTGIGVVAVLIGLILELILNW